MKITQIDIFQSKIKLIEPFVTSLGPVDHAENVIVRIRITKGLIGYGECSPYLSINGESMETAFAVGKILANALHGINALKIEECTNIMDSVIYGNSSIKSAFDMALYDIASQENGMPLYKFLGGDQHKKLTTDYTVSIGPAMKMAEDAKKIKERGFRVIKVKLGGSREEDVIRIHNIREAIGYEMPLRIDANQGWDTKTAIEILNALQPYNIQHCEEPIPRWNFMELPEVHRQSPIPIMADESCCDDHDAKRLIDLQACDLFNIKLGKSSGIFKAKKIIELAEAEGIKIQVGGFLESRLAFTASAHLALSSANIIHCDFDTPLMFEHAPVVGGITYAKDGTVTVPDAIGLGASFDEKYLSSLPTFTH